MIITAGVALSDTQAEVITRTPGSAIESFCRGDEAGDRAVFNGFAGPVCALAVRILGDRELAADCVQEAFFRAWLAASKFDRSHDPALWLFTIARRVALAEELIGRPAAGHAAAGRLRLLLLRLMA